VPCSSRPDNLLQIDFRRGIVLKLAHAGLFTAGCPRGFFCI
jgi:hypothetical protein